jgi:hypothetical protein
VSVTSGKTLRRDYKDVRRHVPGAAPLNAWMMFGAGLTLGLAVAFGVHLNYQNRLAAVPVPDADVPPASAQAPEESPVPAEAEKLQARLAQYGVDAKIQRFSLEDETWYRVRIGPIATVEELESVRAKLAEAEIEATPVTNQSVTSAP